VTCKKSEFLKCWYSTKGDEENVGTALLLEPTPEFYRDNDDEEKKFKIKINLRWEDENVKIRYHVSVLKLGCC
jgi:hypothetical protein